MRQHLLLDNGRTSLFVKQPARNVLQEPACAL